MKTKKITSLLLTAAITAGISASTTVSAQINLTDSKVWVESFIQESSSGYTGWQGYKDESVASLLDENGNCGLTFTSNGRNDDWGFFAHSFDKKYDSGILTISMDVSLDEGAELWVGALSHIVLLGGQNPYSESLRQLLTTDEKWGWGINHQLTNDSNQFTVRNAEVSQIFSTWPVKLVQSSNEELTASYNQKDGDYTYLVHDGGTVTEKSFSGNIHSITIVADCSNYKVQTYIDGVALSDTAATNIASYLGLNFRFVSSAGNSGAKAVVDNISVRHEETASTEACATVANAVNALDGTVEVVFSDALKSALTKEQVTVKDAKSGAVVDVKSVTGGTNNAVLNVSGLNPRTEYVIVYDSSAQTVTTKTLQNTTFKTDTTDRQYLAYEDFESMQENSLPGAMSIMHGNATAKRVEGKNGGHAAEVSAGSEASYIGFTLRDAIVTPDEYGNKYSTNNTANEVTLEFDMKNENGGFVFSFQDEEEINDGLTCATNALGKGLFLVDSVADSETAVKWGLRTGVNSWDPVTYALPYDRQDYSKTKEVVFDRFNEWVHVKLTIDGTRTGDTRIVYYHPTLTLKYADGTEEFLCYTDGGKQIVFNHLNYNENSAYVNDISNIGLYIKPANGEYQPKVTIDNVKVYVKSETAQTSPSTVSSVTIANGEKVDDVLVPAGRTSLNVNFADAMGRTVANYITLSKNGVEVPATGVLSEDGTTYTIIPEGYLASSSEYVVTVDKNALTAAGALLDGNLVKTFNTDEGNFDVSGLKVNGTLADETISASVDYVNTKAEKSMWLIVAQYKGEQLIKCEAKEVDAKLGEGTLSTDEYTVDVNADSAKAFCWDKTTFYPYLEAVKITK